MEKMDTMLLVVGIIKNKKLLTHDYMVTCCRYENGKTIETKDVRIYVETCWKRQTAMKYAKVRVLQELNKNIDQASTKNRFQYFSII